MLRRVLATAAVAALSVGASGCIEPPPPPPPESTVDAFYADLPVDNDTMSIKTLDAFGQTRFVAQTFTAGRTGTLDKVSAILNLLQFVLTPEINAMAFDSGYFYPGPSIEGATIDLAPQESQDLLAEFGRDWYDALIEEKPKTTPLPPEKMVQAFDIWDREIGSGKYETS